MLFVARGWAVFCVFVLSRRGMHLVLLETFAVIRPPRFELERIGVAERRSVRRLKLRVVFREIRFARRGLPAARLFGVWLTFRPFVAVMPCPVKTPALTVAPIGGAP